MGTKLVGDHLSRGIKLFGDHLFRGAKFSGTVCPWVPNLMGTVCPGGSILQGSFIQGNRNWATESLGIKWVRDQMHCSPIFLGAQTLWFGPYHHKRLIEVFTVKLRTLTSATD